MKSRMTLSRATTSLTCCVRCRLRLGAQWDVAVSLRVSTYDGRPQRLCVIKLMRSLSLCVCVGQYVVVFKRKCTIADRLDT